MNKNNEIVTNMNTNFLKLIAIISMMIDHMGYALFFDNLIMRSIGRIAFPIFTYCAMIGYFKTKDLKKYILRLFILGLISQPFYTILFNTYNPNIMFTILFEVLLYYTLDNKKWFYLPFLVILSFLFKLDYVITYLFLVPIFYYFRSNKFIMFLAYITFYFNYAISDYIYITNIPACATACAIFALPFILSNTKINIKINKYFFYFFYPIHIFIIILIKYFTLI